MSDIHTTYAVTLLRLVETLSERETYCRMFLVYKYVCKYIDTCTQKGKKESVICLKLPDRKSSQEKEVTWIV